MSSRSEALKSLRVAIDRCHGNIPLSDETAKALGLKSKSLSQEDARDLLDQEDASEDPGEAEADPAPATKPKSRKAKAEPVATTDPVEDPLG